MKKGLLKKITACVLAVVMVGTLASSNGIVKGENTTGTTEPPVEENENINLSKTAEWNDTTQEATIKIESYTTGSVTTSTVPSDIVLVLDTSGSMKDGITSEGKYELYNGRISQAYNRDIFVELNGEYIPVNITREWVSTGFIGGYFVYTMSYTYNGQVINICEDVSGDTSLSKYSNYRFCVYTTTTISRMEALQNAVNAFIDQVNTQNNSIQNESDKNRLSIIRFSDSATKVGRYNENLNYGNLTIVNNTTAQLFKSAVNGLNAEGGTHPEDGLNLANNVLGNQNTERNQVVIMFTDGGPGGTTADPFDDDVAIDTIENSKVLKDKGVTVYSVGVFDGANTSDVTENTDEMNRYMHGVSSNYPVATGHRYGVDGNGYWEKGHLNQGSNQGYYLAAGNADELKEIFDKINDDINAGSSLDETSYVSDVISDTFVFPENVNSVKAYSVPYLGDGKFSTNQAEYTPISSENIILDSVNREIQVKGFDYSKEYLLEANQNNGVAKGRKLVIEIKLKPTEGFIGGNQILTNDECSVKDSEGNPHRTTDVNTIDIPLMFDFDEKDAVIYVGSDWDDVQRFLNVNKVDGKDVITYKNKRNNDGRDQNYNINGINNEFVDITYTIQTPSEENPDELVTVGKYIVDAGKTIGRWETNNLEINSEKLRDCKNFVISVNVSPIKQKSLENETPIYAEAININNRKSTLHIMNPVVTLTDEEIFLGQTSNLNNRVSLGNNWEHDSTAEDELPSNYKIEGTNKLTYEYSRDSGSADLDNEETDDDYTPTKAEDATFHVTVKNGEELITDATKFNSGSSEIKGDNCEYKNHFTVYVNAGTIEIFKELNLNEMKVDETDGDPIFTYKIERETSSGNYETVGYEYVKLTKEGVTWVQTREATFGNLPEGNYVVTEETPLRYEFMNGHWNYQGNSSTQPINDAIAEFSISDKNSHVELHYTNKVKSDDFDSDNGILINKFVIGDNGNLVVEKDKLDK